MSSNALVFLAFFAHAEQSEHGLNASVRAHEPGASAEMSLKEELTPLQKLLQETYSRTKSEDQSSSKSEAAGGLGRRNSVGGSSSESKTAGFRKSKSVDDSSSELNAAVEVEEPEPRSATDCADAAPVFKLGEGNLSVVSYFDSQNLVCVPFLWNGVKQSDNLFDSEEQCKKICAYWMENDEGDNLIPGAIDHKKTLEDRRKALEEAKADLRKKHDAGKQALLASAED